MKIASKQAGLVVKSDHPKFKYKFLKADEPLEVAEAHAEKILKNPTFYKFEKTKSLNKSEDKK